MRRAIPRKRFRNLPARPFGCGMRRHVEVNDVTSLMGQDDEDKQQRKLTVGTTKKSIATNCWTWLSRKVRQVCEGGFR